MSSLLLLISLPGVGLLSALPAGSAYAEPPPISAAKLALPAKAFPAGATIRRRIAGNRAADVASGLHTRAFGQLGRLSGYLEVARWSASRNPKAARFTLRYLASEFSSDAAAARASQNALDSLWRFGLPVQLPGKLPAFKIRRSTGTTNVVWVLQHGSIETELDLSYAKSSYLEQRHALASLAHLERAGQRLEQRLAPGPTPQSTEGIAPLFLAPSDAGPVIVSPSLLAFDSNVLPAGHLDAGYYADVASSALGKGVTHNSDLILGHALSDYVRTGDDGYPVYQSVALYSGPLQADEAFVRLQKANVKRTWLHSVQLPLVGGNLRYLTAADGLSIWSGGGEVLIAARVENVVSLFVQGGGGTDGAAALADRLVGEIPTWLHAAGTQIVNVAGVPVRFASLNWYGAEEQDFVPGGLKYASYQKILRQVKLLGYNVIRLPFSNQLVEQNPIVRTHLSANGSLIGLHALDVLDRIIAYAGALDLRVVLDDHRSDAGWSAEENGLWYTPSYPDLAFDQDWASLAKRYARTNTVVGADIRNEPHGPATWGDNNPATDWKAAAERAGDAVLAVNPHLLVIVEGVQNFGSSPSYWWGGNLLGVASAPVSLHFADGSDARSRLVYSVHDYGPDNCGGGCPWFNSATSYSDLKQIWDRYWGYVFENPTAGYSAPVWVGEFGTCNYRQTCTSDVTPGSQGQWFTGLLRYLGDNQLGWGYWSINGTESTAPGRTYGTLDWYGLLNTSWTSPNPWIQTALASIQPVGAVARTF